MSRIKMSEATADQLRRAGEATAARVPGCTPEEAIRIAQIAHYFVGELLTAVHTDRIAEFRANRDEEDKAQKRGFLTGLFGR